MDITELEIYVCGLAGVVGDDGKETHCNCPDRVCIPTGRKSDKDRYDPLIFPMIDICKSVSTKCKLRRPVWFTEK